uniref:Uncharacterized protein n=1 Tax=Anguilla anguilla TaxID=7936 RepID=A0A0E9SAF9_ANGAN
MCIIQSILLKQRNILIIFPNIEGEFFKIKCGHIWHFLQNLHM